MRDHTLIYKTMRSLLASRILGCFVLLLGFGTGSVAQNLIPNFGFEEQDMPCDGFLSYTGIAYWITVDCGLGGGYYHVCSTLNGFPQTGTPDNLWGTQEPVDGSGYSSMTTYSPVSSFPPATYLSVPLLEPLTEGIEYCFSMHLSLAEHSAFRTSTLWVIGTSYFPTACNGNDTLNWPTEAQLQLNTFEVDTAEWSLLSGSFVADGGEVYLTVGDFSSPSAPDTTFIGVSTLSAQRAVYYVDALELRTCESGVAELSNDGIAIYPNPAADNVNLIVPDSRRDLDITITDVTGRLVYKGTSHATQVVLDASLWARGYYSVQVEAEKYSSRTVLLLQ